jgi:hypothetical protein
MSTVKRMTDAEIQKSLNIYGPDSPKRPDNRWGSRAWQDKYHAHVVSIATEFGARRGWIWQTGSRAKYFDVYGLRGLGLRKESDDREHPYPDHSYYYRDAQNKPAALVFHPYEHFKEKEFRLWQTYCDARGLALELPTDFPSWHYPGRTTLVGNPSHRSLVGCAGST